MTTLIEKKITRAPDEQQKNLFNIINGNFEISKQEIDELKKKVIDLRHSTEHTEKSFRRQGSTRGRKFRTHRESRTGNV